MSSMSDRKAELERKKAKLQALREEKDRRRREKEQKDAEEALVRNNRDGYLFWEIFLDVPGARGRLH